MRVALFAIAFIGLMMPRAQADEPLVQSKGLDLFERKIRPVLAEHCYQCHSAQAVAKKKLKGGLRLDTRAGLLKGGDSGPALTPGKADESLLLDVLRYDDVTQMPPDGKLPDAVIADFAAWVNMGAPDPRIEAVPAQKADHLDIEKGRRHWAYRSLERQQLPAVRESAWPKNVIDRYILARLESKNLRPGPDADKARLARRLYYDLLGLPPTPEEVDAFVADTEPEAYERLVDRLLASPHFGERWGRHWLDVARFGESLTLRGFVLKEAWRYRDYVIDAFNRDLPFDQFLAEQVAGDLLPAKELADKRNKLVATTFLVLGNTNLEEQDKEQLRMDVVDEQLDTLGKAMLAQTIGCARCHDHKFDPIPTRDYYALAGILRNAKTLEHANVSKWLERPLPAEPEVEAKLKEHEAAVAVLEKKIKDERAILKAQGKATALKGSLAATDLPGIVIDDSQAKKVGVWKESQYSGTYVGAGYSHDLDEGKGEKSLTFQPELPKAGQYEIWLAYAPGGNRSPSVPVTILSAKGEEVVQVDMKADPPIDGRFISLGRYPFENNGQGYVLISNEGTKGHVIADAVLFLPAEEAENAIAARKERGSKEKKEDSAVAKLEAELKTLKERGPKRDLYMTVAEEAKIEDARVHIRGSVHSLGDAAPRGFLQVASWGESPAFSSHESGRRELAEWITSEKNPLTARVFANRAWHWLFGAGLSRTPDNFGTTGEAPSHPELLDALALQFQDDGWSVKRLVKCIVLSHTYRLASTADAKTLAADPENRLLAHANRRRLDAECLRDTMLAVSGQLDLKRGGPSFAASVTADYGFKHNDTRRSVYSPVFRNALPELFEAFDFADPSTVVGQRNTSTVAPQALFLLNHPFVLEQSKHAAQRLLAEPLEDDKARAVRAYRLAVGRTPTDEEIAVVRKFVTGSKTEEAWAAVFQALFASVDFRYLR